MKFEFSGFLRETVQFFADIKNNNNKQWFEANRAIYNDYVLDPAQAFVVEMGEGLRTIAPQITAIPICGVQGYGADSSLAALDHG